HQTLIMQMTRKRLRDSNFKRLIAIFHGKDSESSCGFYFFSTTSKEKHAKDREKD
ncbi:hypothetical protein AVEN_148688-1, partial [Araneus ventricosus]